MAATAASLLLPIGVDLLKTEFIPLLTKLIDKVFGGKSVANPSLGSSVKFPLAQTIVTAADASLVASGHATASPSASISGAIQATVNDQKAKGELNGTATVITPSASVGGPATLASTIEVLQWLATMPASLAVKS
jgi:hypothetical protein